MELTYRGVKYNNNKLLSVKSDLLHRRIRDRDPKEVVHKVIFNQSRIISNQNFPFFWYFKQLLWRSDKRVVNPMIFWHLYKSQFLENCWQIDQRKMLEKSWYLTLALDLKTNRTSKRAIQLKYRGVSYYR